MFTFLQAKEHLDAIISMSRAENRYLSCIREYLHNVDLDIVSRVRAQELKNTDKLIELLDLQSKAETSVRSYLLGAS